MTTSSAILNTSKCSAVVHWFVWLPACASVPHTSHMARWLCSSCSLLLPSLGDKTHHVKCQAELCFNLVKATIQKHGFVAFIFFPSFLRDQILLVKNLILQSDMMLDKNLQTWGSKRWTAKWQRKRRFLLLNFFNMWMPQGCRQHLPCPCKCSCGTFSGFIIRYLNTYLATGQNSSCLKPTCQLFGVKHAPIPGEHLLQPAAPWHPLDSCYGCSQCLHGKVSRAGLGTLTHLYHTKHLTLLELGQFILSLSPPSCFSLTYLQTSCQSVIWTWSYSHLFEDLCSTELQ